MATHRAAHIPSLLDPIIRRRDAARCLGVSLSTLDRLRSRGVLPQPIRVSPRCFGWRASLLDGYLRRRGAEETVGEAPRE